MYWYLSFLRPPPVSISSTTRSITITPQVANDLRTEIRAEPTEIYYIWQEVSDGHPKETSRQNVEHLTTYRSPESTYKSIYIPLPPSRAGQSWRLGLFPNRSSKTQRLGDILSDKVEVIGVWSEPIIITAGQNQERQVKRAKMEDQSKTSKGKGKEKEKEKEKDEGPKQSRIQREWTLNEAEGDVQDLLRIVEQTSFDLDKKIWDSGLALAAWLRLKLTNHGGDEDGRISGCLGLLVGKGDRRVLELGSGTGLVSIALRQYLAKLNPTGHVEISATDLDSAMELMQENIALNDTQTSAAKIVNDSGQADDERQSGPTLLAAFTGLTNLEAKTLDWDNPLPDWVTKAHPDIIIAADVTYNTSSFPSLVKTLRDLMLPNSGERPPLLLAYKQRDEAERELWDMLKAEGVGMELVDKIRGAEEDGQVEIWIGSASR